MLTRRRGSKRLQSRGSGGRYRKATMENTFGLRVIVCEACRGCNPVPCGESKPEKCSHCGKPLVAATE